MDSNQVSSDQKIKRGKVHEGPRNHFITYAVSMVLTLLAFLAVYNVGISTTFVFIFIVMLAIVQAVFQLAYWMHMKDRGHLYAIIGISMGAVITIAAFVTALYWMWW